MGKQETIRKGQTCRHRENWNDRATDHVWCPKWLVWQRRYVNQYIHDHNSAAQSESSALLELLFLHYKDLLGQIIKNKIFSLMFRILTVWDIFSISYTRLHLQFVRLLVLRFNLCSEDQRYVNCSPYLKY